MDCEKLNFISDILKMGFTLTTQHLRDTPGSVADQHEDDGDNPLSHVYRHTAPALREYYKEQSRNIS